MVTFPFGSTIIHSCPDLTRMIQSKSMPDKVDNVKTLSMLIFVIIFCCPIASFAQEDHYHADLKGKIRQMTTEAICIISHDGKNTECLQGSIVRKFSNSGNQVETFEIRADGTLDCRTVNTFCQYGIKESVRYNSMSWILSKSSWIYNSLGQLEEKHAKSPAGIILYKSQYEYDDSGNLHSVFDFASTGLLFAKTTYGYDKNGRKTEEVLYRQDNGILVAFNRHAFKYNNMNLLTDTMSYYGDGLHSVITNDYDESGFIKSRTCFDEKGKAAWKYFYETDKSGNIILEKRCNFSTNGTPLVFSIEKTSYMYMN